MTINPTIDLTLGTHLSGGNETLAKDMIRMLQEALPDDFETIKVDYTNQDYDSLQKHVHKLHGAASYCGTPALKKAALELELALKDKQLDNVAELYTILSKSVQDVLQAQI